jgi:hypothetical protein
VLTCTCPLQYHQRQPQHAPFSQSPAPILPSSHHTASTFVYSAGIKPIAEVQRKLFNDKSENKGKPYARVLFLLARNINYVGYTLWRSGVTLACGSPVLGLSSRLSSLGTLPRKQLPKWRSIAKTSMEISTNGLRKKYWTDYFLAFIEKLQSLSYLCTDLRSLL